MSSIFEQYGLPMQPGEPSWASLKCSGGPHTKDITAIHSAVTETISPEEARQRVIDALQAEVAGIQQRATERNGEIRLANPL